MTTIGLIHLERRLFVLLSAFLLDLGAVNGLAQSNYPPSTLTLTIQNDGQTIVAATGQRILVNLAGNPSTGYTWLLTSTNGDAVLSDGPATFTPDTPGMPGSGGTFSFPFQAVKPGTSALGFAYRRSGTPPSTAQTFSVTIQVIGELPRLSIALVESKIEITWPITNSDGYYIEGTGSLTPPHWAAANVLPVPDGPNYKVVLGVTGQTFFFRLRR